MANIILGIQTFFVARMPTLILRGVMLAAEAVKLGYKWNVGNDRSIRFWEDLSFGNILLANQFFDIYFIVNQQTKTIVELWDANQLRCTIRRTFSDDLMIQWQEVLAIVGSIVLSDQEIK
jgi:hypothetical protein